MCFEWHYNRSKYLKFKRAYGVKEISFYVIRRSPSELKLKGELKEPQMCVCVCVRARLLRARMYMCLVCRAVCERVEWALESRCSKFANNKSRTQLVLIILLYVYVIYVCFKFLTQWLMFAETIGKGSAIVL